MSRLVSWISRGTGKLLDPHREARIAQAAAHVEQQLAADRSAFSFDGAIAGLELYKEDVPLVASAVYKSVAVRAWRDGAVTEKERRSLEWIAGLLKLDPQQAARIEEGVGRDRFASALAGALSDGRLTDEEVAQLRDIARNLGMDLGGLMRSYFRAESDGLMRQMFSAISEDERVTEEEWTRLTDVVAKLGLTRKDLLEAIQVPATRFVERALAEAKNDGDISAEERKTLAWLLSQLITDQQFKTYVRNEVQRIDLLSGIARGALPSVPCQHLGLRAGELVHLEVPAAYLQVKQLKSGPQTARHDGVLLVTDSRAIFSAPSLGLEINHRKVLDLQAFQGGLRFQTGGKGNGTWLFGGDAEAGALIYATAVRRANQTIVFSNDPNGSRRIPRDVRQRVWQRDGGRCTECGSDQYLEFDHVIPVARGGSNSEVNVQLLCRKCNGLKSDHI